MPDEPFTIRGMRLGWPVYLAAIIVAFDVQVLRRPIGLLHPNLWAEDGPIFIRAAYLDPVYKSLFHPYNGYWHLLLRVWAEITTLLPVSALAISYSIFSLLGAVLCNSLILSRRMRWLIPSDAVRAIGFVILVLLPGTSEITGNLTNALWPVAIALVLLSFSDAPRHGFTRGAELVAVALMSLTGAASLLVWPGFTLRWWRTRAAHDLRVMITSYACAAIQVIVLLANHRDGTGLSMAPRTIVRAVVLRIWGTLTMGEHTLRPRLGFPVTPLMLAACAIGIVVTIAALVAVPWIVRLHWAAILGLSIAATSWAYNGDLHEMSQATNGGRYFVVPLVLVVVLVLSAATSGKWKPPALRAGLLVPAAALLAFAIVADFNLPDVPPTHWARVAACIRRHEVCTVTVNPVSFSFNLPPLSVR